jgi:hypothetical protein
MEVVTGGVLAGVIAILAAIGGIIAIVFQIRNHRLAAQNLQLEHKKLIEPTQSVRPGVVLNARRDANYIDQSNHWSG